jgi:hypothetical protein
VGYEPMVQNNGTQLPNDPFQKAKNSKIWVQNTNKNSKKFRPKPKSHILPEPKPEPKFRLQFWPEPELNRISVDHYNETTNQKTKLELKDASIEK